MAAHKGILYAQTQRRRVCRLLYGVHQAHPGFDASAGGEDARKTLRKLQKAARYAGGSPASVSLHAQCTEHLCCQRTRMVRALLQSGLSWLAACHWLQGAIKAGGAPPVGWVQEISVSSDDDDSANEVETGEEDGPNRSKNQPADGKTPCKTWPYARQKQSAQTIVAQWTEQTNQLPNHGGVTH